MSTRDTNEDSCQYCAQNETAQNTLHEDGVLYLSECRVLDPNFAIKHFAENAALLILDNPWLFLVAVDITKSVKATQRAIVACVLEQFPWPDGSVMQAVQYHTHALGSCNERGDTQEPTDGEDGAITPANAAQRENDGANRREDYGREGRGEDDTDASRIAVGNGPSHEIGMGLFSQYVLSGLNNQTKSGRVCRISECLNSSLMLAAGQVQLAWRIGSEVCCNDSINLSSKRLNRD